MSTKRRMVIFENWLLIKAAREVECGRNRAFGFMIHGSRYFEYSGLDTPVLSILARLECQIMVVIALPLVAILLPWGTTSQWVSLVPALPLGVLGLVRGVQLGRYKKAGGKIETLRDYVQA